MNTKTIAFPHWVTSFILIFAGLSYGDQDPKEKNSTSIKDNLTIYGVINSVQTTERKISIEFTGIARLILEDTSLKDRNQYFSLTNTVIHLKFDNEFKGMHTYSNFRYLDWINEEQAIALLKEYQNKSSEVSLVLDAESLAYTKNEKSSLRVSTLIATVDEISLWSNLFKETILEHTKDMGIRYELAQGRILQAEQAASSNR